MSLSFGQIIGMLLRGLLKPKSLTSSLSCTKTYQFIHVNRY